MKTTLIILSLLFSLQAFAQTKTAAPAKAAEATSEMKEFAEGSYLQIDQMDVPDGLRRIEDQIKENVIDVIIHSKTHMPIFAQKRPEGYSANYKKFNGLEIRILPIKGEEDFYSLKLFYYNWTTNKSDKHLTRKISKYNVLNEVRMASYELLMGKQWVMDNKDKIEARNFERIQAVRQVMDQNARLKKKKEREELKKQQLEEEAEEKKRERKLIKREDKPKKEKKEAEIIVPDVTTPSSPTNNSDIDTANIDPEIEKIEKPEEIKDKAGAKKIPAKTLKKSQTPPEPEPSAAVIPAPDIEVPIPSPPKKSYFSAYGNYFQESADVKGLLATRTDLKYFGGGGKFILQNETQQYPTGMRFGLLAAMPIFKEKYAFPIYRSIESEYFISKLLNHVRFYGGLDFTPVYFVTLPSQGQGLQVYENDFLWAKAGIGLDGEVFDHAYELRFTYLKSLILKSNQTDKFSATKTSMTSFLQVHKGHGAELNFSTTTASGSFEITSTKIGFSYVYKFEN